MARSERVCMELNFIRDGEGRSRRSKIKSFWEFIDARKDLVPFHPLHGDSGSNMNESNPSVCQKPSSPSLNDRSEEISEKDLLSDNLDVSTNCQADQSPSERRLWYNELRILKELGLDRVALVASNACKRCLKDERNNLDNEPELADSVPQSYEELKADLKAFQERVKHQRPKFAYKDPGKYKHLMQ